MSHPNGYTKEDIKRILRLYQGAMPVYIHMGENRIMAHKKYWVNDNQQCLSKIEALIGAGNVWVI